MIDCLGELLNTQLSGRAGRIDLNIHRNDTKVSIGLGLVL